MSKIVFMGDSITEYMPYIFKGSIGNGCDEVKYFGVENIGVGSYMNYCWPHVDHDDVNAYILLIGINNISRPDCDYDNRETLDELVNKLKEFIDMIINSSSAKLYVQSIYPTKYIGRKDSILFVNEKLENYCNELGVTYINLYNLLIDGNELLDKKYSDDGIHPNSEGYKLIADEINRNLKVNKDKELKK